MKLVYLDTSNLALLSKIQGKSPIQLQAFINNWRSKKYTLAISEAHLFEIVRHGSDIEKKSRFDLLKLLLPFRFERILFPKEIIFALKSKKLFEFAVTDFGIVSSIFSENIYSINGLLKLQGLSRGIYLNLTNSGYELSKNLWQPNRFIPQKSKDKKFRVEDLPSLFPPALKSYFQELLKRSKPFSSGNPVGWNQLNKFVARVDIVGFQQAFIEMAGADERTFNIYKKPIEELQDNIVFKNSLEYFLSEFLYTNLENTTFLANQISIEDCPGQWLKQEVEKQIRKSGDSEVSNQMDLKHISHLPYVDILIADKRIVDKTIKVIEKAKLPESLKSVPIPFKVSNTLKSLEKALF